MIRTHIRSDANKEINKKISYKWKGPIIVMDSLLLIQILLKLQNWISTEVLPAKIPRVSSSYRCNNVNNRRKTFIFIFVPLLYFLTSLTIPHHSGNIFTI